MSDPYYNTGPTPKQVYTGPSLATTTSTQATSRPTQATSTPTPGYFTDYPTYDSGSDTSTAIAFIIGVPVVLTLCCIACGVVIGVLCCRRCRNTTNHGMILSLPTTVQNPQQGYNYPNQPVSHNVPEEPAPEYETLQIDRSNLPSYEDANKIETNDDDAEYEYIPADESQMPTRGQRSNNNAIRSPAPLPKPPTSVDRPGALQTPLPAGQYLTVSGQGNSSGDGKTDGDGYLTPTGQAANGHDYLDLTGNADGYLAPRENTDGYLAPRENTDGYLVPTDNADGYLAPTENTDGYLAPSTK